MADAIDKGAMADWEFRPDYIDKMTGLPEDSEARNEVFMKGGRRSRKAFREQAKPGATLQILAREEGAQAENYLVSVNGLMIGMITAISAQVSVRNGLTISIGWPRETPIFQEVWQVESFEPAELQSDWPIGLYGIQMVLKKDFNEHSPIDADLLEDL